MVSNDSIDQFLNQSARRRPNHPAVVEADHAITYDELAALSDRLRDRLGKMGVVAGDRAGVYLHKSIDSVAAIFGILKVGATYVPVDPLAPASRNAYSFNNCSVRTAIVKDVFTDGLRAEMATSGAVPELIATPGTGGGKSLAAALSEVAGGARNTPASQKRATSNDLAMIFPGLVAAEWRRLRSANRQSSRATQLF